MNECECVRVSVGSHEVNANVDFGANAIFSFRQFTSNALTPRGGSAKSKRETFLHNATFVQVVKGRKVRGGVLVWHC